MRPGPVAGGVFANAGRTPTPTTPRIRNIMRVTASRRPSGLSWITPPPL